MKLKMSELKANFKGRIAAVLADNPDADLLPKLNQTTLGEAIGLSQSHIRDLAKGELERVYMDRIDAVSNTLKAHGFTLDEIWDTGDTMTASKRSLPEGMKANWRQ